jgi:hypothetical protein
MNPPGPEKLSGLGDAPVHLGPPPRVPDYELVRRVGGGSYGDVWLARGITGAWRAIKVVHRGRFDRDKPYEREFAGVLRFEPVSRAHESQVDILHVGRNDDAGCFYYVMELADDQRTGPQINPDTYTPKTLRSELQSRGRLPLDEVLRLGISLATALEHLHAAGLVHRDVKPSNIIYIGGVPKLADIGLVTDSASTRSFVGTEGYLPPEGPGAPAADVFSLGKVLYEAATGCDRLDFPELPADFATWPDRQRFLELNEVLLRACAPALRERYTSAVELGRDLERLRQGVSLRRRRRVRRAVRLAGSFVVAGALVTLGIRAWNGPRRPDPGAAAVPVRTAAMAGSLFEVPGPPAREALRSGARRLREQPGDLAAARAVLSVLSSGSFALPAAPALTHRAGVNAVAFSPDGTTLLAGTEAGAVVFWDWRAGRPVGGQERPAAGAIRQVLFSADGRLAAAGAADGTVSVWDARSCEWLVPPLRAGAAVHQLEFSPAGDWLAFGSVQRQQWIWPTDRAGPARPIPGSELVVALRFAPDGQRLLSVDSTGAVRFWRLPDLAPLEPFAVTGTGVYDADWSADGRWILLGTFTGAVRMLDAETLRPLGEAPAHTRRVLRARFSPDGGLAVTLGADRAARFLHVGRLQPWGRDWEPALRAHPLAFTPDGLWLAALFRDHVQVLGTFDAQPLLEPIQQPAAAVALAVHPVGGRLAVSGPSGLVQVWEMRPGRAWADPGARTGPEALVPWVVPEKLPPAPAWLADLAEWLAGEGGGRPAGEGAAMEAIVGLRDRLRASGETDFWSRWGRWFFADRATRAINPDAKLTVPQLAGRVARARTLAARQLAVQLAPDHAPVWAQLAALLREQPESAGAPRRFTAEWCEARARALSPSH